MTTLRLKLSLRLSFLGVFIFLLSGTGGIFYSFGILPHINLEFDWLLLLSQAVFFVLIIFMGFSSFSYWKYRIDIETSTMQSHTLLSFPFKSFNFAFSDVTRVQAAKLRGVLEILLHNGQHIHLAPESLEGGTKRLLAELGQHIPPEKFAPDLLAALRKRSRMDYWFLGFQSVALLFMFFVAFSSWGWDILRAQIAWEKAVNLPTFSSVEGFSVSPDNTAWLVVSDSRYNHHVFRVNDTDVQKWDLPAGEGDIVAYSDAMVAGDSLGQPAVIFRGGILHFQDNAWHSLTLPPEYKPLDFDFSYRGDFISGDSAWFVAETADETASELLQLDLATGNFNVVPVPDSAKQRGLQPDTIRPATDGSVLVLMSGEAGHWIYPLRESVWRPEYAVSVPESTWIWDFKLDEQGQIWVLCNSFLNHSSYVERISPLAKTETTSIPVNSDTGYKTITIDARGRIWAAYGFPRAIAVFEPVWGGTAQMVIQYDDINSGYQSDTQVSIFRTTNGRIWAADHDLIWIYSNLQDLPATLPTWLVNLKNTIYSMVFMKLYVGFSIIYLVVAIIYRRKTKL